MEVDAPAANGNTPKEEPAGPVPVSVEAQLETCLKLLDRAVRAKDTRLIAGRLLRQIATLRSNLTAEILFAFVEQTLPQSFSARETLLNVLHQVCLEPKLTIYISNCWKRAKPVDVIFTS